MSKFYMKSAIVIVLSISFIQVLLRIFLVQETKTKELSYIAYVTAQGCQGEDILDHITASECANIAIFDTKNHSTLMIGATTQIWLASLSWSYDQRYLTYSDGLDIFVYDTKHQTVRNITDNGNETLELYSMWSPTDYVIAFTSYVDTTTLPSLWIYKPIIENQLEITDSFIGDIVWSPDGDTLVIGKLVSRLNSFDWYLSKIDDGSEELLFRTNSEIHNLVWSDDGSCIIFAEQDGSSTDVFSMCSGQKIVTKLTHGPLSHMVSPRWAYGGNVVPYSDVFTNLLLIHLIDLGTNIIFNFPPIQDVKNFDFSRDGTAFAYMTTDNKLCIFYFLQNRTVCSEGIAYPGTMLAWSS